MEAAPKYTSFEETGFQRFSPELKRRYAARVAIVYAIAGWLFAAAANGMGVEERLKVELEFDRNFVTEIDPGTGEEISVEQLLVTLSLEGIREEYLYVVEGSSDLKNWSELDRFYGEPGELLVERLLESFEAGFVRLRLTERPAVPTGISASEGVSEDRVIIAWDDSSPPDGYTIYQSESDAFSTSSLIGTSAGNSYEDASVERGATYFYWIGSKNGDAETVSENSVRYVVPPLPIPSGFVSIPAGAFNMGSPLGEPGRDSDETLHEVTLTNGFHMSESEVTWAEWMDVRDWAVTHGYDDLSSGRNGRNGDESGTHPVTEVSWWNAIKWCNARSEMEGRTPVYYTSANFGSENLLRVGTSTPFADWSANGYRLPTEAEWEFACRAESSTAFYTGVITNTELLPLDPNLNAAGWYGGNSESKTHAVGGKQANAWGLRDMHGNVREWCWDWYGAYGGDATDPKGESSGAARVFRGGSWGGSAGDCRSANRDGFSPAPATDNYGFRAVLNSNPT